MIGKLKTWLKENDVMLENDFKKVKIGEAFFAVPFSNKGMWVVDRQNQNLCECLTTAMAKQIAQALNLQYM